MPHIGMFQCVLYSVLTYLQHYICRLPVFILRLRLRFGLRLGLRLRLGLKFRIRLRLRLRLRYVDCRC